MPAAIASSSYSVPSTPVLDLLVLLMRVVNHTLRPKRTSGDNFRVCIYVDTTINVHGRAEREEGVGVHVAVIPITSNEVRSPRHDRVVEISRLVRCDVWGDDEPILSKACEGRGIVFEAHLEETDALVCTPTTDTIRG